MRRNLHKSRALLRMQGHYRYLERKKEIEDEQKHRKRV
jgi:hypothetical protein